MRILPHDQTVLDHVAAREAAIVGRAVDWANVNSGSRNAAGLARMLDLLGVNRIRLMTNNPGKVAALQELGVDVAERVAHQLPANPHNERYLATKRDRTGHLLR